MEFSCILGVVAGLAGIIYFYIRRVYSYWERQGVPYLTPTFPFGNGAELGKTMSLSEVVQKFYNEFKGKGKFGGIYLSLRPEALLVDLDLIKSVTIKDFDNFCNKGLYSNEEDDPLSGHLLALKDEKWRTMRQKLSPTFTSGKIKTMFETVTVVADRLIQKIIDDIKTNNVVDVKDAMGKLTTDVIASTAFGIEADSLKNPNSEFYLMGLKALQDPQIIKRFLVNSFPNLAKMLHVGIFPKELSDFYFSVVRNTIKYREENSVKRNDFMNLMIQMKNSTGSDNITVDQITAQSFIFFLAGYETAATTLTYCLYELSLNKDYQERLRNEIKEVLEKHDNNVTYEAITEMTYMDQVLDETLRKYPPAPLVQRICKADYKVPGTNFTWKANTNIKIPIYAIHHDPEIYPNPDVFDPERFTPEEVAKRHPCSFIPFGSGPRLCIGMRFALIEAKIALVKLLTTFKFESFKKLEISKTQILLQPEGGVLIKFEKL